MLFYCSELKNLLLANALPEKVTVSAQPTPVGLRRAAATVAGLSAIAALQRRLVRVLLGEPLFLGAVAQFG